MIIFSVSSTPTSSRRDTQVYLQQLKYIWLLILAFLCFFFFICSTQSSCSLPLDHPWLLFWKFSHSESLQCFHTGRWTRATLTLTDPWACLERQLRIEMWCPGKKLLTESCKANWSKERRPDWEQSNNLKQSDKSELGNLNNSWKLQPLL